MRKTEIIGRVTGETGMTRQAADAAVGTVFASIAEALARGEEVSIAGFGRFSRKYRPARKGRNPQAA